MLTIGVAAGSLVIGLVFVWMGVATSAPYPLFSRIRSRPSLPAIPQRVVEVVGPMLAVWAIGGAVAIVAPLPAVLIVLIAVVGVVIGLLQYRAPQRTVERMKNEIEQSLLFLINNLILYRQLGVSTSDMCRMVIQLENAENRAVMTAIRYALDESLRSNRRPFVLVYEYAETIGSDLLREVAAVMQQHEQGADVGKALIALRDSIGRRMKSRILQRIERRKLALLGVSAVAVLVGVVVHILYVAIVGGRVWDIVGGAIG